jgi:hypothetical protein
MGPGDRENHVSAGGDDAEYFHAVLQALTDEMMPHFKRHYPEVEETGIITPEMVATEIVLAELDRGHKADPS